jgi:hypothetical protein
MTNLNQRSLTKIIKIRMKSSCGMEMKDYLEKRKSTTWVTSALIHQVLTKVLEELVAVIKFPAKTTARANRLKKLDPLAL